MKKAISIFLTMALSLMCLVGCAAKQSGSTEAKPAEQAPASSPFSEATVASMNFSGLNDPALLQFTQDALLSDLESTFSSDDVVIEEVNAVYVSKEYLEELAYNSQSNIYFGYTLADIESMMGDTKYVFTLGEDGQTTVKAFEGYDDTFDQIARNVAIGGGVILVCVVVTVATGGAGAPAAVTTVNAVFAASAKTAATFAVSGGALSAAVEGVVTGVKTGDVDEALKAAALAGSEGFMWGAIIGAATGGTGKALELAKASKAIPTPRESELRALEKFPGQEQVSYLNGERVNPFTPGATRPDIVSEEGGKLIASEVKNYNLETNLANLKNELSRQVAARVENMPEGTLQRIILDVKNRGYSDAFLEGVKTELWETLSKIDPEIVIEIMR